MITTVAIDAIALFGQLDFGYFEVLFRKFNKQINYRRGPRIPYITAAGGSFTDPRDGVKWEVSPSGVISYDRLLDKTARDTRIVVFMPSGDVFYQDEGRTWRRRGHGGKWVEPQKESPLQVPGVDIPGLRAATEYEICALATTSKSTGVPSTPVLYTTPSSSRRRLDISVMDESAATYIEESIDA